MSTHLEQLNSLIISSFMCPKQWTTPIRGSHCGAALVFSQHFLHVESTAISLADSSAPNLISYQTNERGCICTFNCSLSLEVITLQSLHKLRFE